MASNIISAFNGKSNANGKSNGSVLPSKRKASNEGDIKEEIKHAIKNYVGLKNVVQTFVENKQVKVSSFSDVSPYPDVPDLPNAYHLFNLHHGGLPAKKRERAIASAKEYHALRQSNFLGYQLNLALDYEHDFATYLNSSVNNIGDPFQEGNLKLNSKFMERAVLDYYAELWHAKYPHDDKDPESYWGFCLTMGSTEANLYGMWNGRDYLSGKKILVDNNVKVVRGGKMISVPRLMYQASPVPKDSPNKYTPIAFYSEDTHYSLAKCMTVLEVRTFYAEGSEKYPNQCPLSTSAIDGEWPAEVPSHDSGAIDIAALSILVEFFAKRGHPILVCFNYGTTFKGAYDDVSLACDTLKPILEKYNLLERKVQYDDEGKTRVDTRTGYWFHVDGALGASYMPYIEMAYQGGLVHEKGPVFDFRLPMVHSMAMSGHKWIGASVPCGVYMTRTKYQMLPPDIPEYIGTPDTTFAGSRNGLSPMLLWDNIARNSYEDQIEKAVRLEELAAYAEERLRYLQDEVLKEDIYVERTPLSLTVHFKRASDEICRKYSLSNEDLNGQRYSHVFLMEHVTKELLDAFIEDLSKEGAFAPDVEETVVTLDAGILAPTTNRIALVPSRGRGFHG